MIVWLNGTHGVGKTTTDYTGGILIMPMTVLIEPYWRESSGGLADCSVPVRHFVLPR